MAEKLTLKKLSGELEQLRTQMQELEMRLESTLAAAKPGTQPASPSIPLAGIDTEQRQRLITEEAYLIAERRGFQDGDPALDWAEAERLVDYKLMHPGKPGQPTDNPKPRKARATKKPGTTRKTAAKTAGSVKS